MGLFFQFHRIPQYNAIKEALRKIEKIKDFFETQTTYHFYSSSIVITYEANLEEILMNKQKNNNNENAEQYLDNYVRVKMVDFAHVLNQNKTIDENYLFGLKKLIYYLRLLLETEYMFKDVRYLSIK